MMCRLTILAFGLVVCSRPAAAALGTGDIHGIVSDSTHGAPIPSAQVIVQLGERVIISTRTDPFGHFRAHHLPSGLYTLRIRVLGFRAYERQVRVVDNDVEVNVRLSAIAFELSGVSVSAGAAIAVDTRTGEYLSRVSSAG